MQRINLNKLYYFYVVAKEGSVKAASQLLNLTQPTISGQVRELEDDMGFELFTRKHRKLELNANGKRVLKKAEEIFLLADSLADSTRLSNKKERLEIKIGAIQSLSNSFINNFSTRLWRDESVRIHIVQGHLSDLIKQLNHSEIDILLSDGPLPSSKKYQNTPLGRDQVVAVASPKLKLSKGTFPQNLDQIPYLAFSNEGQLQAEINYYFERHNIHPELLGKVDDITLMRVITKSSSCFSIMPRKSVRTAVREKKLKILGQLNGVESDLWAITPKVSTNRRLITKLIKDYFNHNQ